MLEFAALPINWNNADFAEFVTDTETTVFCDDAAAEAGALIVNPVCEPAVDKARNAPA
jgi:hypothetical protein